MEDEKPRVPTFQEFQAQFDAWIDTQHAGKPGTIKFYRSNYQKLLEFEPMRDLALDRVDEAVIERSRFWALRNVGRTTVNRYLATLRKALRYARWKLKRIDKAPVIEQYQNERQVEYIFDANTYRLWIDSAEDPLHSASIVARNSGITRVEMLNLEKDCVTFDEKLESQIGEPLIRMDRAPGYRVALRVTTSAIPSTSAYVAKRNAPYLPPDVACSFGMKVERLESTRASPIIPGIASRSIADVQFAGEMCRQRRMALQRTAEAIGDRANAPQ